VNLSSSPSGGTTPYSYSWDFGDASALGTTQNPSHLYAAAGSYTAAVTLTDAAGHSVKGSVVVVVSPALSATAGASPTTGEAPLPTTLSGFATGGTAPFTYAWDLGDGSTSTQQTFSHTYSAGSYTIALTIHDAAGLSASVTTLRITVYSTLVGSTSATPIT